MRLNRVLLLAATINLMIFALVFTISCSGDDGKNGKDGSSCTVRQSGSEWKITCDGEEIGVLKGGTGPSGKPGEPGEDGEDGEDGKPGKPGQDGESCILGPKVNGSYQILCGPEGEEEVKGSLDGCSGEATKGNEFEISIACGSSVSIKMCNGEVFDPDEQYCDLTAKAPKDLEGSPIIGTDCDGKKYDTRTSYCGIAKKGDKKPSILPLCGPYSQVSPGTPGGAKPNKYDSTLPDLGWASEYCEWTSDTTTVAGKETECGGALVKLNENSYAKRQYCGFSSGKAVQSVQEGLCDLPEEGGTTQGPNEKAFNRGYCAYVINLTTGKVSTKTQYVETICGNGDKPNNSKDGWKNQGCGFKTASAKTSSAIPLCGDHKAPNPTEWSSEYCGYKIDVHGDTLPSFVSNLYCGDDQTDKKRPINKDKWSKQYCGQKEFTGAKDEIPVTVQLATACANGSTPNATPFKNTSGKYVYNYEFCQVSVDGSIAVAGMNEYEAEAADVFATDDELDYDVVVGYCANELKAATPTHGNPVNKDKWNKEYCGFTTGTSAAESTDTTYTDGTGKYAFKLPKRLNTACADGQLPNSELRLTTNGSTADTLFYNYEYCQVDKDNKITIAGIKPRAVDDANGFPGGDYENYAYTYKVVDGYCGTNYASGQRLNDGSWKKDYCGFATSNATEKTKISGKACDDGTKPNAESWDDQYCMGLPTGKTTADNETCNDGKTKLNVDSWKGQYCFADDKPAVCNGGKVGDTSKLSTDTDKCVFE